MHNYRISKKCEETVYHSKTLKFIIASLLISIVFVIFVSIPFL